ncbi:MAG: bifunctional riboflavin kinase/FAD synthetase [Lachnospirales bacterium]
MKILDNNERISENSIVLIGNFDGIHMGHQKLLKKAIDIKNKSNKPLKIVALTFYPHPRTLLKNKIVRNIFTLEEKAIAFEKLGANYLKVCDFNEENRNLSPEEFVDKFLYQQLNCRYVIVGEGFTFSKNKSGNVKVLIELSKKYDFEVVPIKHYESDVVFDDKISSTTIRDLIKNSDIKSANELLGRPFFIIGKVCSGKMLGRTIGFPTANINVSDSKILPKNGVYATKTKIRDKIYKSITNVGINPTFDVCKKVVETNLFDYDGDLYGEQIVVEFFDYIRSETKFTNIDELKKQIEIDVEIVKKLDY